jgi:hypothetical protein
MACRRLALLPLVLFALVSIGAKECSIPWPSYGSSSNPSGSDEPWCLFDPPVGCAATCVDVGQPGFTPPCDDISASKLTAQFENAVGQGIVQAFMAGNEICPEGDTTTVTPCQLGIFPQPNPPEPPDVCTSPPPNTCVVFTQ